MKNLIIRGRSNKMVVYLHDLALNKALFRNYSVAEREQDGLF